MSVFVDIFIFLQNFALAENLWQFRESLIFLLLIRRNAKILKNIPLQKKQKLVLRSVLEIELLYQSHYGFFNSFGSFRDKIPGRRFALK